MPPEFSPDGRWLANGSNESGRDEVYVTSLPGREETITVARQGGWSPSWSREGKRLFYYPYFSRVPSDGRQSMMAVAVRPGSELSLGAPVPLFRLPAGVPAYDRFYEQHPDGRCSVIGRFVKTEPPPPITRLDLVQNWFAELERLAPTRR